MCIAITKSGCPLQPLPIFKISYPQEALLPFVFNSPHSGFNYTNNFLSLTPLSENQLRKGEDTAVDIVFEGAIPSSCYFMKALFPRSFIDVNREPYELDPKMFDGKLPDYANTRSIRVAGGLGVIPRIIGENTKIYNELLTVQHGLKRIETYYKPYHAKLLSILTDVKNKFGCYVLVDCHSMPSSMPLSITKSTKKFQNDIVIGDRFGESCSQILTEVFETEAKKLGYKVARNAPYAGGYITEHYGNPKTQGHAIQIEINRALYMDEKTLKLKKNFTALQSDLQKIIHEVTKLNTSDLAQFRKAAE